MSKLTIREVNEDPVTVLNLRGSVTEGQGVRELGRKLRRLFYVNRLDVLLNFTGVTKIDEAGMKLILDTVGTHGDSPQRLKISHFDSSPGKMRCEILTLTHLMTSIDIYGDDASALLSFHNDGLDRKRIGRTVCYQTPQTVKENYAKL